MQLRLIELHRRRTGACEGAESVPRILRGAAHC